MGRSRRHGAVTRLLRGGHYTTRGDFLKAGVGNGHARRFRDLFDDAGRSPGRREQPEKSMGVAPVRIHHRVGLQRRPTAASVWIFELVSGTCEPVSVGAGQKIGKSTW